MTAEQLAATGIALESLNRPIAMPTIAIRMPKHVARIIATGENPLVEMVRFGIRDL